MVKEEGTQLTHHVKPNYAVNLAADSPAFLPRLSRFSGSSLWPRRTLALDFVCYFADIISFSVAIKIPLKNIFNRDLLDSHTLVAEFAV